MEEKFSDSKPAAQLYFAAQVNQFVNTMAVGDVVISPFKTTGKIAIGEVTGAYGKNAEGRPVRPVKWLRTDLDRASFKQDMLYSFGAIKTVCEMKRNDALNRVLILAKSGGRDSGDGVRPQPTGTAQAVDVTAETVDVDLELIARDQIEKRIASSFVGHDFTRLIAAILKAHGYVTCISGPAASLLLAATEDCTQALVAQYLEFIVDRDGVSFWRA